MLLLTRRGVDLINLGDSSEDIEVWPGGEGRGEGGESVDVSVLVHLIRDERRKKKQNRLESALLTLNGRRTGLVSISV